MPYSSVDDLPDSVKERIKSSKRRRQWLHVWNSVYDQTKDESRAFASANGAVKKVAEMTTTEQSFNLFLPIDKVDKERRTVSGYASTECLDLDGEIVSKSAIEAALPGYWTWRNIREMHTPSAVGRAQEANIDEKGLYLTAKIVDDAAWKKVDEGVYNGFSIGGRKLAKTGNKITKVDLIEISIVDRPANPECKFTVQKNAKIDGAEAFLLPAAIESTKSDRIALKKMAEVVDILASEPAVVTDNEKADKKAKKLAKKAEKAEKKIEKLAEEEIVETAKPPLVDDSLLKIESAPEPALLVLDADSGAEAALDKVGLGHELDLERSHSASLQESRTEATEIKLSKRERKLLKRMGVAGSLSYCFDSIRSAQRDLIVESKREGGDRKDLALANKLGTIANSLAGVISQKAEHEGIEALDLSDADDKWVLSTLKEDGITMAEGIDSGAPDALTKAIMDVLKTGGQAATNHPVTILKAAKTDMKRAKEMRQEAEDCVKAAFEMHKAAYLEKQALVKAGKAKESDGFDHAGAMKMLQKAFSALSTQKTFAKSARDNLAKAASRISAAGTVEDGIPGVYQVPEGIRTISPGEMADLPASKAAKSISPEHAEALVKAARAEAKAELLESMPLGPAHGRRPMAFDMSKLVAGGDNQTDIDPVMQATAAFFKGANTSALVSEDQTVRETEIAKSIGNNILGGKGRSVIFDPQFQGAGGGGSNSPNGAVN